MLNLLKSKIFNKFIAEFLVISTIFGQNKYTDMTKILLFTLTAFFSVSLISFAQIEAEIFNAGQIYAYAQLHADQEVLLDFTYPLIVDRAGGRGAMKNVLAKIHRTQSAKGHRLVDFKMLDPIQYVLVKDEIHALVPIKTVNEVPGGKITAESTLIAVGTANRQNWYFIETTSLDERNIFKVLPNWNNSLVLPPKKAPLYKENQQSLR